MLKVSIITGLTIAVTIALAYVFLMAIGLAPTEGFRSTKCFSCERQDPQRAYGSKCFSCEGHKPF